MTLSRSFAVMALFAALAAPVAGCGGDDDDVDQFREDYNAAVDRLSKINSDIGEAAGGAAGQSNTKIAQEFDRIAETAETTRSELSELEPPGDARDEFDKLLAALKDGVGDLRGVAKAAKDNDPQAAQEAVRNLQESGEEITAAEDQLKNAVDK
jgi:hypothetical protein